MDLVVQIVDILLSRYYNRYNKEEGGKGKIAIPWFIFLYVVAMVIATYIPQGAELYEKTVGIARYGMIYTLFLIGSGLSWASLKQVGARPILLGVILWVVISVVSAVTILYIGF